MRRKLLTSTLIIFSLLVFVVNTYAEKRVALIIGNSEYISNGYHPLAQPVNDAEAFDKALKSFGFETIVVKNGTQEEMTDSLLEFVSILDGADAAVFYYSGHGNSLDGVDFIVPAKTDFIDFALEEQFLSLHTIMREMQKRSKLSFVFYDACRNNPGANIDIPGLSKGGGFVDTFDSNHLMICYATAQGKTASAGDGTELSPFTEVIIDNIYKQEDFEILWFDKIKNDKRLSNQEPQAMGGYSGKFYFNQPMLRSKDEIIERLSKTNVNTYNDGELFPLQIEKKWGFIDKNGDFVIPPNYNYAHNFTEGLALICGSNWKYGYIDAANNIIFEISYSHATDFYNGLAIVWNGNMKMGCIDKTGKEVLPLIYQDVIRVPSYKIVFAKKKRGKYGVFDYNGIQKVPFIYDEVDYFSEGLAAVKKGRKWGYINGEGNVVIDALYNSADEYSEGLAAVKKGKKWGYIDKNGKVVIDFLYDYAERYVDGVAVVRQGDNWGVINKLGHFIVDCVYDWHIEHDKGTNSLIIRQNGLDGVMSLSGDIMIPPTYGIIRGFVSSPKRSEAYEISAVMKGGKWGFIDKFGNIISQCIYDDVDYFSEGLCAVKKGGKWGYIDKNGKVVIDFQYEYAKRFSYGLAKVSNEYPYYDFNYINNEGKIVR